MANKIYLDYSATTPVHPQVLQAMLPYFNIDFGNTSSIHSFGQQAEAALESARESMSAALNCQSSEIVFTSCGSESDNLALRGAALAARIHKGADTLLVTPVEHHAVTRTAKQLEKVFGFHLEYLPVDRFGQIDPDDVRKLLSSKIAVVSVIYANNEVGTINPVSEIGLFCREMGVVFHTDAVQAAAYLPLDVEALNVDLMALGAHKFYGPKGVGALYIRNGTPILPMNTGGSQEHGLRAGTHNTPYIIGMAEALNMVVKKRQQRRLRLTPMRDNLIGRVLEEIPNSQLTGHPNDRLPNHASFVFEHVDGNALLMLLDVAGYACSSGSACKVGDPEPSEVLTAMGYESNWSLGSLRVTLGSENTPADIDAFSHDLPTLIAQLRLLK
jgi:cysteine desulfurase